MHKNFIKNFGMGFNTPSLMVKFLAQQNHGFCVQLSFAQFAS